MAGETKSGGFLVHIIVVTIAVWVATQVVPGVSATRPACRWRSWRCVLGLVNAIIRPILCW